MELGKQESIYMIQQIRDRHVYAGESIQDVVDQAVPGDRIVIHEGTYRESVKIDKSDLEICGAEKEKVILKGSRILGELYSLGRNQVHWGIPENWDGAVGWIYGNGQRYREVRKRDDLKTGCFMLTKWELPVEAEISEILSSENTEEGECRGRRWQVIKADEEGILELQPLTGDSNGDCVVYLHVWAYSPKKVDGSLQLGSCDPDKHGRWPMSLVNDFHGFRRPDGEYRTADQPATIWLNGECLEGWRKHNPSVTGFQWQEGWNSVLVQLKTAKTKAQRWFLRVCTHKWANSAIDGVYAGAIRQDNGTCRKNDQGKGIIVSEYRCLGPFADKEGDKIIINAESNTELELSCLDCVLQGVGDDCSQMTVSGLHFSQTATNPKNGMLFPGSGAKNWVIEDCEFRESTGSGIDILSSETERSSGHRIRRCRFIDNGCLGIQGWGPSFMGPRDILVEDCCFEGSNWLEFSLTWHASSIKFCRISDSVFRRNIFRNNDCYGIWLDWECEGNLIEHNTVDRCKSAGIFIEASRWGNRLVGNQVTNTRMGVFGGCGIYMHDSSDTYVMENVLIRNEGFGYRVGLATNRKLSLGVTMRRDCNVFMKNYLSHNGNGSLSVPKENIDKPENFYDGNTYWGVDAPPVFELAGCQGDDDVFDAVNGFEPEIKRELVVGLDRLREVMGQEENSSCHEWSCEDKLITVK